MQLPQTRLLQIRATGAAAIQINTGKGCHLDAAMVETALARLALADDSVLMVENCCMCDRKWC